MTRTETKGEKENDNNRILNRIPVIAHLGGRSYSTNSFLGP